MREDMIERESNKDTSKAPHQPDQSRVLTYDEIKAAEAALRGEPFNPAWSAAAAQTSSPTHIPNRSTFGSVGWIRCHLRVSCFAN